MNNKFLIWLSKPYLFGGCLAVSAFIISIVIFKDFWISFLNTIWIVPVMSKLYGYQLLVAILLLILSCVYYVREFSFAEKVNIHRLWFWIIYSFLYLICIIWGPWDYSLMSGDSKVSAWTNLSLLPVVVEIVLALKILLKKQKDCESSFLEVEKTENIEDTYGRTPICKSSFDVLRTCFNNERSFSVAITGEWGSGKTTFMQELKSRYENERLVKSIVWFEPWKCDSPDLIIKSFFGSLRRELRVYIPSISSLIDEYVLTLLDNDAVKPLRLILAAFRAALTKEHESPYERIREVLAKTQHKVVVFIDDIDRLDSEEIKEVLRLIRNTADFPYVQFIVAYDKEYVTHMLGVGGINDATKYLEKFFNIDIPLPKFEERRICEELYRRVMLLFDDGVWSPSLDNAAVNDIVYRRNFRQDGGEYTGYIVPKVLSTMRDVIRFGNALKMICVAYQKQNVQEEVEFHDLFYLELLRYGFDDVYKILRDRPLIALKIDRRPNVYMTDNDENGKNKIFSVILNNYSEDAVRIAGVIMDCLFTNNRTPHSLCNVRDYPTYFMFRLDEKILSDSEFMSLAALDESELSTKVEEWSRLKNEFEFKNETHSLLFRISITQKKHDNETLYNGLYLLLKRLCKVSLRNIKNEVSTSIFEYVSSVRFMSDKHFEDSLELFENAEWNKGITSGLDDFIMSILYCDNLTTRIGYTLSEKTKEIIRKFLRNTKHQEDISNALLRFIESFKKSGLDENKLVIGIVDISDIQVEYFKEYPDKFSEEGYYLFLKCWDYSKYGQSNRPILRKEVLNIMKTVIEVESDKYFETFIREGSGKWPDSVELFPAPYFDAIFGGYDEFEEFLNSAKQSSAQMRVKAFWSVYKNQGYLNIIVKNIAAARDLIESGFDLEKLRSCVIS